MKGASENGLLRILKYLEGLIECGHFSEEIVTPWKLLVAALSGNGIDAELVTQNEYFRAENRALKEQLGDRKLRLTDAVRIELAEKAMAMKRSVMELTVSIVTPTTILRWHRELIKRKWDTSDKPKKPGRPRKPPEIEQLVEQFARENRSWGYDRIMDAVKNLGYEISDQTVGNILKRLGLRPSPERKKGLSWREFLARHAHVTKGITKAGIMKSLFPMSG